MTTIDLNCDMGELPEAIADGTQESLMPSLTSVNIACGGHAGDDATMAETVRQALRWNLAIGAHPGFPDRANFGRLEMNLPPEEIAASIGDQIEALTKIAASLGVRLTHVKPHGALYNQAAQNREIATAIAEGVARVSRNLTLVGLAGSSMLAVFREAGFPVASEAFADRRYEADGTLRSRKFPDALIRDPEEAARQALNIAQQKFVIPSGGSAAPVNAQTICIHGDTPGATQLAAAVANCLRRNAIQLCPLPTRQK
ncbi:MAG TPA: 5-oxoprolinase subunit PxpA [Terriglobales bacterium]